MTGRDRVIEEIRRRRVGAIIRTGQRHVAAQAVEAVVDGGFTMVEFTMTTPGALELISRFAENKSLLVGAGTVMDSGEAQAAVDAGASFLVSPIADAQVIAKAAELDVVSIPGVYTPNEMVAAHRLGADILKIFPAPSDLPTFIRQVLGPMPYLKVLPTAGVTPDNFIKTLLAGAFAVSFVSSLFVPEDIEKGNFQAIRRRAEAIMTDLRGSSS